MKIEAKHEWNGTVVLLDGKVFSWKGHRIRTEFIADEASFGALGTRYFPDHNVKGKVEIHRGIFTSHIAWESWIAETGFHENSLSKEEARAIENRVSCLTGVYPICEVRFDMEAKENNGLKYWWPKDGIQKKPWEEV